MTPIEMLVKPIDDFETNEVLDLLDYISLEVKRRNNNDDDIPIDGDALRRATLAFAEVLKGVIHR